jgi:predicted nucleotidyltransferase
MLVPEEFAQLLDELNRNRLPYVLIGGVAVNLLGRERYTHDVDVLVPATQVQGEAIRRLLEGLQATRVDGSPLSEALFDGEHHIRALTRFGIIDFIPEGDGDLSWESINSDARPDTLHEIPVRRVSLEHLLALKRLAGRPQDREDVVRLEEFYGLPPHDIPAEDAGENEL